MDTRTLIKELEKKRDELKILLSVKEDECGNVRFRLNSVEAAICELGNPESPESDLESLEE